LPWPLDPVKLIHGTASQAGFPDMEKDNGRFDFSFLSFAALEIMVPHAENICVSASLVELGNKVIESKDFDPARPYFTFKIESDLIETKKKLMSVLKGVGVLTATRPGLNEKLRKIRMKN
jgi:hypothetical protein